MHHLPKQSNELVSVWFDASLDIVYTIKARCEVYGFLITNLIHTLTANNNDHIANTYHVKGDRIIHSLVLGRDESYCVSRKGVLVIDRIIWTMPLYSVRQC
jgi:hypothetical protein